MTDEPFVIEKLRAEPHLYLTDGEPAFFGVAVQDILDAWAALTQQRDDAVRDARRWREFTQGINRVHDSGFDECVIRYDTSELAHLAVTDIRNVLDAARTADAEATP